METLLTVGLMILVPKALIETYRLRRVYQLKYSTLKIKYLFWKLNRAMNK